MIIFQSQLALPEQKALKTKRLRLVISFRICTCQAAGLSSKANVRQLGDDKTPPCLSFVLYIFVVLMVSEVFLGGGLMRKDRSVNVGMKSTTICFCQIPWSLKVLCSVSEPKKSLWRERHGAWDLFLRLWLSPERLEKHFWSLGREMRKDHVQAISSITTYIFLEPVWPLFWGLNQPK